ncbi:SMI1/KNR4 family protein [Pontibacter sp. Tf4]|uniref:SMI1/KNR4 family protein n=1 Tax=Pontibacter sp. Tf4 TaxID=2761620 RepID=UPI0016261B5E|nr:SMI1/KNR4 family protein [Pontibacter sp. Tf4]MBB6613171.1 SMI1/KNR4 family protein [Pontibacter sp. Tf4]
MNSDYIKKFVDISLENLGGPEDYGTYVDEANLVNGLLIDNKRPKKDNLIPWKPSDSLITDKEIQELETELKYPLPNSFKQYLKYKNFYELGTISNVGMFTPLLPNEWKRIMLENVFDGWPREELYDKGMIPFANYSDYGLLCFNTNAKDENEEYEIVKWDHEVEDEYEIFAQNFGDLMKAIVQNYEEGIKNGVVIFY